MDTLLVHFDKGTPAIANEIKEALEGNDVPLMIDALKKAIMLLLNGESIPQLFITIVRYVVPSEDHTIQMVVLELIRKVCRANKGEKGKYIKIIISLLSASSAAVVYECAGTLVSLSSAPTAIRAAANTASFCSHKATTITFFKDYISSRQ